MRSAISVLFAFCFAVVLGTSAEAAYSPYPLDLGESIYMDDCHDPITLDRDEDYLKDHLENKLADAFKPYFAFDTAECAARSFEPVVVFQVTPDGCVGRGCPSDTKLIIRYGHLYLEDGGFCDSPWPHCYDIAQQHAGDNQSINLVFKSSDGGRTWKLDSAGCLLDRYCFPQDAAPGSTRSPVVYLSAGKHHEYWKAHEGITYDCRGLNCTDAVDGKHPTLNKFADLKSVFNNKVTYNNVGEVNANDPTYFVHCMWQFPSDGDGDAECGGTSYSAWGGPFYDESENYKMWIASKITHYYPDDNNEFSYKKSYAVPLDSAAIQARPTQIITVGSATLTPNTEDYFSFEADEYLDVSVTVSYDMYSDPSLPLHDLWGGLEVADHSKAYSYSLSTTGSSSIVAKNVSVCPGTHYLKVGSAYPHYNNKSLYWCYEVDFSNVKLSKVDEDTWDQGTAHNDDVPAATSIDSMKVTAQQTTFSNKGDTYWKVAKLTHHNAGDADYFSFDMPLQGDNTINGTYFEECKERHKITWGGGLATVYTHPSTLTIHVVREDDLQCDSSRPFTIELYDDAGQPYAKTKRGTTLSIDCPNKYLKDLNGDGHKRITFSVADADGKRGYYSVYVMFAKAGFDGEFGKLRHDPPTLVTSTMLLPDPIDYEVGMDAFADPIHLVYPMNRLTSDPYDLLSFRWQETSDLRLSVVVEAGQELSVVLFEGQGELVGEATTVVMEEAEEGEVNMGNGLTLKTLHVPNLQSGEYQLQISGEQQGVNYQIQMSR